MPRRRFTKGIDLYNFQVRRLAAMQATMKDSVRVMRAEGLKDAQELTSGTLTRQQTKGRFARGTSPKAATRVGRLRGRLPLLPLNIQTGRLRRSMIGRKATKLGFEILSKGLPYSKYILSRSGTRLMVARGLKQEAERRLKARQKAHIDFFKRKQRNF